MTPGIASAATFQCSGFPWVTSSIITSSAAYVKIVFPSVCKSFTVINHDVNDIFPYTLTGSAFLHVSFGIDLTGTFPGPQITNRHAVPIPISGSRTFDVKCSQIFVSKKHAAGFGAFTILAEMTPISSYELLAGTTADGVLTGSGIDGI